MSTSDTDNELPNSLSSPQPDSPSPKWPSYQRLLEVIRDLGAKAKRKLNFDIRCPSCNMLLLTLAHPVELHGVVLLPNVISTAHGSTHVQPQEARTFAILLAAYPNSIDVKRIVDLITETGNENLFSVRLVTLRRLLEPLGIKIIRSASLVSLDLDAVPK